MEQISKHLQTAVNSEQVQLQTKQHESTEDETALKVAIADRRIKFYSEEELKQVMRYIFMLIGLRGNNYPEGLEKDFLHAYIIENYSGHSGAEIRLAFTMAIQGKLNLDQNDVNCYEHFSIGYFTKIMNAYRNWASQAVKQVVKETPVQKVYTTTQIDNEKRVVTENCYQRFLKGDTKYFPTHMMLEILIQDEVILPGSDDVKLFFSHRMNKGFKNIYERA